MSKHTPGPWVYVPVKGSIPILHVYCPDGMGAFHLSRGDAEQDSNAHLIAAAPELLEALELAGQSAGYQYMTRETREAISAAIAKAKGE